MKRKIEIKDLEKTLKENISTKSTETSGPEKTVEVSVININDKKYVDKDQGIGELVVSIPEDMNQHEMNDTPNDPIMGPVVEDEFRKKDVIQMRIDANDKNKMEDINASKKFIAGLHKISNDLKVEYAKNLLKDLSSEQIQNIEDLFTNRKDDINYESVDSPKHYNLYDTEVVKMMELIFGPEKTANWAQLNAFKYRMRMGLKPTAPMEEDFKKEQKCLKIYNELKKKLK